MALIFVAGTLVIAAFAYVAVKGVALAARGILLIAVATLRLVGSLLR